MAKDEIFQKEQRVEGPAVSERRTFLKQMASAAVVAGAAGTSFAATATKAQPTMNAPSTVANAVQDIALDYDESTYAVTVTPDSVQTNTTVRFMNPKGAKVRVVFLSPRGNETDTVLDSESCTLTVGGIYHFKCFFLPKGATTEITSATGGGVEVQPHKP
jgi:hypothetical protein